MCHEQYRWQVEVLTACRSPSLSGVDPCFAEHHPIRARTPWFAEPSALLAGVCATRVCFNSASIIGRLYGSFLTRKTVCLLFWGADSTGSSHRSSLSLILTPGGIVGLRDTCAAREPCLPHQLNPMLMVSAQPNACRLRPIFLRIHPRAVTNSRRLWSSWLIPLWSPNLRGQIHAKIKTEEKRGNITSEKGTPWSFPAKISHK